MKFIWRKRAIIQRFSIFEFILKNYGSNSAKKFNTDLMRCKKIISQNPNIAPVELILEGTDKVYRSFNIDHINKLIYYVEENELYIVSIWDSRRCPDDMMNEI